MSEDETDDKPTVYVANSSMAWGKGFTEEQALQALAGNIHKPVSDTVSVTLVEAKGNAWTERSGMRVGVDGDELVEYRELDIPADEFNELRSLVADDVPIATEAALVEADETDAGEL